MTATLIPTMVESDDPKASAVTSERPLGPTATPARIRNRTLGTRNRSARTWDATPSARINATMISVLGSPTAASGVTVAPAERLNNVSSTIHSQRPTPTI
jgi:hypothetical protein